MLVLGAGSGVSTFAVQLAAQAGARVLVTSSSEEKIERAKELGADGGVLYTEDGWPGSARAGPGGVDVVLDSVGTTWRDSLTALRQGGRLVVFGGTGGPEVDARRALRLPELAVDPRHDDGLAARLRRAAADGRDGRVAARDRQRPPARRGRGGARADEEPASTSASSC